MNGEPYSTDEIDRALARLDERLGPRQGDNGYAPIDDELPFDDPALGGHVVSSEPMIGIDAADLLELDVAPLRMIVPELLPDGTTVLAAPPSASPASSTNWPSRAPSVASCSAGGSSPDRVYTSHWRMVDAAGRIGSGQP